MIRAVIDRIEHRKQAVLLLEPDEYELIVPLANLPEGADEGMWLHVRLEGDRVTNAELDHETTLQTKRRIASKMDRLRQRGKKQQDR